MANYRIVARCDAYHSAKHFSIDEKNVLERDGNTPTKWVFLKRIPSLRKAQKALLKMAEGDAEMSYPNWGIAVRHPNEDKEVECYPTRKDGTRANRNDTITYEIEKEEVLVGLIGHYLYSSSENAKFYHSIAFKKDGKTVLFRNGNEARDYAIWAGLEAETPSLMDLYEFKDEEDKYVIVTPDEYDSIIQEKEQ